MGTYQRRVNGSPVLLSEVTLTDVGEGIQEANL
jgi:hypothetical protein